MTGNYILGGTKTMSDADSRQAGAEIECEIEKLLAEWDDDLSEGSFKTYRELASEICELFAVAPQGLQAAS